MDNPNFLYLTVEHNVITTLMRTTQMSKMSSSKTKNVRDKNPRKLKELCTCCTFNVLYSAVTYRPILQTVFMTSIAINEAKICICYCIVMN